MKRLLLIASFLTIAASQPVVAGDFSLSGGVAYDDRQYDTSSRQGMEEKLNIGWQRTFFTPISLRLLLRVDDFRGTGNESGFVSESHSRRIQPIGELSYAVADFSASLRHDAIKTHSTVADIDSTSSNKRDSLTMTWSRENFPAFAIGGQQHRVEQGTRVVDDDSASASITYSLRGLQVSGSSQMARSLDAAAGYERSSTTNGAQMEWHGGLLQKRLMASFSGNANRSSYDQRALNLTEARVPFPVSILRALFGVDETPGDGRDHELVSSPALIDGSINTPAGVTLGPDGVSYQNLVLELGRLETLDEIRLVVRDERGNPVKRVGLVSFDVYTSTDGVLWSPLTGSSSTWDAAVSWYSITFDPTRSRWFKIVTFGVNPEPVLVTELQAFYHRTLAPGENRQSSQSMFGAQLGLSITPTRRLAIRYGGSYNGLNVIDGSAQGRNQSDLQNEIGADFTFNRGISAGALITQYSVTVSEQLPESDRAITGYVRASPSRRLDLAVNFTRRDSEKAFESNTVDTIAFHSKMRLLKSLTIGLDAGTDSILPRSGEAASTRQFLIVNADAQLYPSLRVLLSLTSQRTSIPDSAEVPLLGRSRDDRAYASVSWSPSTLLMARARFGWVAGDERSAITQQYSVDWNPLQGGSFVIGGSHEEDFDPYTNRRASRTTLRPRWFINQFATLELNYFAFTTVLGDLTSRQRTIYAAVNLTKK